MTPPSAPQHPRGRGDQSQKGLSVAAEDWAAHQSPPRHVWGSCILASVSWSWNGCCGLGNTVLLPGSSGSLLLLGIQLFSSIPVPNILQPQSWNALGSDLGVNAGLMPFPERVLGRQGDYGSQVESTSFSGSDGEGKIAGSVSPLSFPLYFKTLKIKTTKYSESWSGVFHEMGKLRLAGPRFSAGPLWSSSLYPPVGVRPGMAISLVIRADIVEFALGHLPSQYMWSLALCHPACGHSC